MLYVMMSSGNPTSRAGHHKYTHFSPKKGISPRKFQNTGNFSRQKVYKYFIFWKRVEDLFFQVVDALLDFCSAVIERGQPRPSVLNFFGRYPHILQNIENIVIQLHGPFPPFGAAFRFHHGRQRAFYGTCRRHSQTRISVLR